MIENDKATYTLWNGSHMVATYPHTREGYDAALAQAFEYGGDWLKIFSSRDDLVWSSTNEEPNEPEENLGGWPGDGSGMDDFADFNTMEGCDY